MSGAPAALECVPVAWPAPAVVHACTTTRAGGSSRGPYASLNLAGHVGDDPAAVARNRQHLYRALALPGPPCWLAQRHGNEVIEIRAPPPAPPAADGAVTCVAGTVLAVLTADCLPILLADRRGGRVAALHAGWRGLATGIVERGVAAMAGPPSEILAWLGPAIGPGAYEVGEEVRAAFVGRRPVLADAFVPARPGHWRANLVAIARALLTEAGVRSIYECGRCTWSEPDRFYSHRRDGVTGRMATLIWLSRAAGALRLNPADGTRI